VVSAQSWEVELHGGFGASSNPGAGSGALPGTGSASASPRSSWYFGDGALALNQALTFFGLNEQISALDTTLQGPFARRASGGVLGARLDRVLTPRFSVEFSFDDWLGQLEPTTTSLAAVEAARTSFIAAWNALLGAPARGTQVVTSQSSANSGGRQRMATGGLVINLTHGGRVAPYATVGAGVNTTYGGSPSAQLIGSYQFAVIPLPIGSGPGPATFHETDTVTVSSTTKSVVTTVFGFGVKIAAGVRWGVRVEARDYLSSNANSTTVVAAPASQPSQPSGVVILGTSPPLQFSTVPGTRSTLSLPQPGFTTFSGSGVRNQIAVTAGWYWRFR
jgi:hypothetical protein